MAHDDEQTTDAVSPDGTPKSTKPRRRFRIWKWLFILLGVPLILFLGYLAFVMNWAYSSGERAGYVQNFTRRGVIVKTWEGELVMVNIPGAVAEKFLFTVRDDSVAVQINATLGKRVVLKYEEHVGIPTTLFGETGNYVVGVHVTGEDGPVFPQY